MYLNSRTESEHFALAIIYPKLLLICLGEYVLIKIKRSKERVLIIALLSKSDRRD